MACNKTILKLLLLLYFSKQKLMKKIFILLVFFLLNLSAFSQDRILYPEKEAIEKYLYSRTQNIIESLYTMVLNGKIKAYVRDSLTRTYPDSILPHLGETFTPNSDTVQRFNKKDLKGLYFLRKISNLYYLESEQSKLTGIALLYQWGYGNTKGIIYPMMWLKLSELELAIPEYDYWFLIYMGRYAGLCNQVKEIDNFWSPMQQIHFENNQYLKMDSAFMSKMAYMIQSGRHYFDIWRVEERDHNKEPIMITDVQTGKKIDIADIRFLYCDEITVRIRAQGNVPEHDSTLCDYSFPRYADSIFYKKSGDVSGFGTFVSRHRINEQGQYESYTPRFIIPFGLYYRNQGGFSILWFLEDYNRWRKTQANFKP